MLKLRVRHVTDSGAKGRIIQTARGTIEVTDKENGAASLSFSVLDSVADGLREPLFRVSVEYAVGAGEYQPLTRNNVFLVKQLDGDDASQNNLITYTGESYVFAMLSKHWVIVNERTKDGKRSYHDSAGNPVSAGWIAREELDESKAAGWAPDITQSYTATHDSNGVAWTSDDKMKFDISVPTQQNNLIDALINQGMCEVETVGMDFRLLRPGTTRNKTNVVLGGTGIKTIPVKVDGSEKYTRIWVHMDDEAKTTFMHNVPNADMRFGSMDMMLTLSGVSDRATANKLAAAAAAEAGALKTEIAYEWTPDTEETYIPWRDFHVGDTVISKTKSGKQERRVIGLVAREEGDATSVRAIVGERIASKDTKLLKKLGSVSVGGTIGGTGNSFPAQPPKPFTAPIAPAGLVLTANTAGWAVTGEAITSVTFSWQAVSYGVDDSMVDIAEYEIWSRYPSGTRQRDIAVTGANTTATVESWVPGVQRLVSVRAKSTKNVWSEFSDELAVTPLEPKSLVPPAPAQPTIVSNIGGWGTTGAVATVTLDWPSITQSIDGEPINVTAYEVWNEELIVATVTESTAVLTMPSGTTTQLRVRAISDNNLVSDLSEFVSITAATPSVVTRAPSTPTLTTGQGTVVVRWDGTYVSGGTAGARSVTVERSTGSSWVVEGSAMTQAGTVSISGQPGTTVTVRLQAYDQLGRLTGTSSSASITVVGVSLTDLDAAVSGFLNDVDERVDTAQSTADGKNKIVRSTADASASANYVAGDQWWKYSGSQIVAMWLHSGTAWVSQTLTDAVITNLNAGTITAGTLDAARIAANSIEASKLLLSGANLIPGADLRVLTGWVSANITPTLTTATRGRSLLLARNTTDLERSVTSAEFGVTAGATYTVSATVLSQSGGAGLRIEVVPVNSSGVDQAPIIIASTASDNNWKTIRGQWTPPASSYRGAKFRFVGNATTGTSGSDYLVQPRMVEAAVAEMIVDGAITADKVTFDEGFANAFWANEGNFGKISTNFIEPSFGENLNLQANGYIEFIAGRQTDQALALSAVEDLAETANSQVQVVSDSVGTAIALADSAQQTADSAAAAADTVTNRLTEHQAVFRVTPSGAVVGTQDSSQELRLNPGSVELVQNGIPISTWESGKFNVSKIDVDVQAEIGSHSFEAYGSGRTIIRPI